MLAAHEDGSFFVRYDDGDEEANVPARHIKLDASPQKGAKTPTADAPEALDVGGGEGNESSARSQCGKRPAESAASSSAAAERPHKKPAAPPPPAVKRGAPRAAAPKSGAPTAGGEDEDDADVETLLEQISSIDDGTPSRATVAAISNQVRALPEEALLSVPRPQLRSLVEALHLVITAAAGRAALTTTDADDAAEVDGDGGGEDDTARSGDLGRALEAALLLLNLVTVPKMPSELLIDETLEATLLLAKTALLRAYSESLAPTPPRANPAKSPGRKGAKEATPAKASESGPALTAASMATLTLVLERLPPLAYVGVSDSLHHQLTALGLKAAFGAVATSSIAKGVGGLPLGKAGMHIILAIFSEYEAHRKTILTDVIDARLQSAPTTARDSRRTFALPDGNRIQIFTALLLLLIQASAALPPPPEEPDAAAGDEASRTDAAGEDAMQATTPRAGKSPAGKQGSGSGRGSKKSRAAAEAEAAAAAAAAEEAAKAKAAKEVAAKEAAKEAAENHPRMSVLRLTSALIRSFVNKCLDRADDTEHRAALEDFTRDLLTLLGRPEWPAAALVVEKLGTFFCQRLTSGKDGANTPKAASKDSKDVASRAIVVDLLGSLLGSLFEHKRKHLDAPLTFPEVRTNFNMEAQPNDEGEVFGCLCGVQRYDDSQSYMLDCDLCHRWFHGSCVGVDESVTCEQWFCDHCRLSTSVSDQRKRIQRLLSLSTRAAGPDGDVDVLGGEEEEQEEETAEVKALSSEGETTKQLLLNYLQSSATADPAADTAQSALLCEWHKEASDPGGSPLLCSLYQEQQRLALQSRRRYRSSNVAELPPSVPLLSLPSVVATLWAPSLPLPPVPS